VLPKPYYFTYLQSIQLAGAHAEFCDYDADTLSPNMDMMREKIALPHVKVITLLIVATDAVPVVLSTATGQGRNRVIRSDL
jgi:aspartate/methionine/tyrosine aminotransferase